jgi:hypothetical protein
MTAMAVTEAQGIETFARPAKFEKPELVKAD